MIKSLKNKYTLPQGKIVFLTEYLFKTNDEFNAVLEKMGTSMGHTIETINWNVLQDSNQYYKINLRPNLKFSFYLKDNPVIEKLKEIKKELKHDEIKPILMLGKGRFNRIKI